MPLKRVSFFARRHTNYGIDPFFTLQSPDRRLIIISHSPTAAINQRWSTGNVTHNPLSTLSVVLPRQPIQLWIAVRHWCHISSPLVPGSSPTPPALLESSTITTSYLHKRSSPQYVSPSCNSLLALIKLRRLIRPMLQSTVSPSIGSAQSQVQEDGAVQAPVNGPSASVFYYSD